MFQSREEIEETARRWRALADHDRAEIVAISARLGRTDPAADAPLRGAHESLAWHEEWAARFERWAAAW